MAFTERIRWFSRMAMLLFILASVAFLSAITTMRFAIQGREVVMPDVVSKKVAEAQAALQAKGLGMRIEDRIYSDLPKDAVVRQSPPAGLRVKTGQRAHVVLSLGPQQATIPSLEQRSLRVARIELLRNGMQIGEVSSTFLPDSPPDTVLQQDPAAGASHVSSPRVDVLVSLGARPEAIVMPELVGLPLGEAEQRITTAGLHAAKLTFVPLPGASPGGVTSQKPAHGSRVEAGAAVELEVAE
jgi:eukaryotic-like serine/threonine-protein kinase